MKNKLRLYFQLALITLILYVAIRPVFDKQYLADFEQYCPFGGISSYFSKLNQDTMACSMSGTQVFLGLFLLLTAAFIGKLFCSFLCPIGTVSEWLGRLGHKFRLRRELPPAADRALRLIKYILLFTTVYITMTTSELFCKTFDPYFASANLFGNSDIILYYAIPALIITIAGAFFTRLFWCKYACPLSAVSNVFMNSVAALSVTGLFFAANLFGAKLGFTWLLGGLALAGWINESFFMKSFLLPLPKIVRNTDKCTACGLCDRQCPQGINVSKLPVVRHIDCHLCTDCVVSCPVNNALSINNKKYLRYLSPASLVIIVLIALAVSGFYEFTTVSIRWNKPAGKGAVYTQAGLKDVKCFGSSMSLAGKLETVDGIYGLDTYAKSHTVKVYYNPEVISGTRIKELLFTPVKMEIRDIDSAIDTLAALETGINGLFDAVDFNNLFLKLKTVSSIYGFEARFGEPVQTTIYYDPLKTSPELIKKVINSKLVTVYKDGGSIKIETDFETAGTGVTTAALTVKTYMQRMFEIYDDKFNSYDNYNPADIKLIKLPMPKAGLIENRQWLEYLSSHLSADEGILRFCVKYDDCPTVYIYYTAQKTNEQKVRQAIGSKKLKVFISDTETEEINNPFL